VRVRRRAIRVAARSSEDPWAFTSCRSTALVEGVAEDASAAVEAAADAVAAAAEESAVD
jgi:hypothetical protein